MPRHGSIDSAFVRTKQASTQSSMTTSTPTSAAMERYKMGYSKATTSSHASRTVYSDASFVVSLVKPHHKLLDVGCGPGTITIGFASLVDHSAGGHVTGVDIGLPVIQSAAQVAESNGLSFVTTFQQGDILAGLPFPEDSFDVVYTSQTLSHLAPAPEAPVKALKEIRRVLKPGGVLAARDAAQISFHPFQEELQRCFLDRMFRVNGTPCGMQVQKYLRLAGWDMDMPEKLQVGGGTTIVAGKEKCLWWRDTLGGRLARGDPFRESWLGAGISEAECDESREWINRWAETEDAWYGVLQSEVLAWK